jgi:hypothetical protein
MKKLMEILVYTFSLPAIMASYALAFAIIAFLDYCHFLIDTIKDIANGEDNVRKIDIIDRAFYDKE